MEATNTIYEIMTLLASATKGLKKSIDLDGIDIFIAQNMTDIVRKVRDLAPEEMDLLLSQLKCELNEENYVRVCCELSGTMSEYLDLYESHKAAIDEGYSPFHLCEIAKAVECHDHDIFNKLEGDAPLALSKIVTRMMEPFKQLDTSDDGVQSMQQGHEEVQKKKPGRPRKEEYNDFRELFKSEEGYNKFCDYVIPNGPFNGKEARSLYEASIGLLKTDFGNAKVFGKLMKAKFPDSLSFAAGSSIYNYPPDYDLVDKIKKYLHS